MRRFFLYKRNAIYYCQLRNPLTNEILNAKSTEKKDREDAERITELLKRRGHNPEV